MAQLNINWHGVDFERLGLVTWMQAMIISFYNGNDVRPA